MQWSCAKCWLLSQHWSPKANTNSSKRPSSVRRCCCLYIKYVEHADSKVHLILQSFDLNFVKGCNWSREYPSSGPCAIDPRTKAKPSKKWQAIIATDPVQNEMYKMQCAAANYANGLGNCNSATKRQYTFSRSEMSYFRVPWLVKHPRCRPNECSFNSLNCIHMAS